MSFREKSAWIILITLVVLSAYFILNMPRPYSLQPDPSPYMFTLLVRMFVAFVGVVIIGHVIIAVMSPRDAKTAGDEREKLAELRATSIAARSYVVLTLGGGFVLLHITGTNVIGLAYMMLASFVLSEMLNYGLRIFFYRRGS